MKLRLKFLQVGLSSVVVSGMLILPTGAFATSNGGEGENGSKQSEILHQVDAKGEQDSEKIKAHAKADAVIVTPLAGKVDGKLRFQCVNHSSEPVSMKYALKGSNLKKEVTLAANETKVIEIDSAVKAFLDLWVGDVAKTSVESFNSVTASPEAKADLVLVKALVANTDGKIRFQLDNKNAESITVKYALAGSDIKKELTLAANETKVIELESTGKGSLNLWVNEVAKKPVEAVVGLPAQAQADLVSIKPLLSNINGKIVFQCFNHGSEPITMKYALAGSDFKQELNLGAYESRVIELASAPDNAALNVWVNEVSKAPITAIVTATGDIKAEADLVVVKALPVKELGKIRFQFENDNAAAVKVTYALAGSDLKKVVDLGANEIKIIEIETGKDKASLDLWVNEAAKTPVEANIDLTVLNPDLNLDNGTGTNAGTDTGSSPGTGSDTSVGSDSTGGNSQGSGSIPTTPTAVVIPDSQHAAAGSNGNQPGSDTLVAGVIDSPGTSLAGYDQLPQTGEQVPWFTYLIGSLMVLVGALTLTKLRRGRRTH